MLEQFSMVEKELIFIIFLLILILFFQIRHIKKFIRKIVINLIRLFKILCFYILWLFPRDKKLVIFSSDAGNSFLGNPKFLFLEFVKDKRVKSVWITKSFDVYNSMKEQNYNVFMCKSLKGRWYQLRAGYVIHSHSIAEDFNKFLVGGATEINLWHGVGLKRSWYRNINSFTGMWYNSPPSLKRTFNLMMARLNQGRKEYVIGTSEEVNSYYPETYNVKPECVLNLGQARNDVFFDQNLEDHNLPDFFYQKKVITYMPTHREYGTKRGKLETIGTDIDYEKLSKLLDKYNCVFVIKQHRWNTNVRSASRRYKNIIDISQYNDSLDTQTILKYTDILISDYSSCYNDFLLLDRPVLFYCYDLDEYLDMWDTNFDYDYITPGPKCFSSDELLAELEKYLKGKDSYQKERARVKRVFYSPENQNMVSKKQKDYIIEQIILGGKQKNV